MEVRAGLRKRGVVHVGGLDGRYPETTRETGELVREVQFTRALEREALARAGMEPLAGGELVATGVVVEEVVVEQRRRWWFE